MKQVSFSFKLQKPPLSEEILGALPGLFARSFRLHGRSHYSPQQIEAALNSGDDSGYALFRTGSGLVAIAGGRIAGCGALGGIGGHGVSPDWTPSDGTAFIRAFCTDPEFSGRGVGRALMNGLFDLARTRGVTELRLTATLNAVDFYKACGFVAGQTVDTPCTDGICVPGVPMTLALPSAGHPPGSLSRKSP